MRSIRRELSVWLLGGLGILWVVAGAGIYFAVQSGLTKSLDAELALNSRIVRFAARGEELAGDEELTPRGRAGRLKERMPAYDSVGSGEYFQIWDPEGNVLDSSGSLEGRELPFPSDLGEEPEFDTLVIDGGEKVRAMSFRVSAGGVGRGKGKGRHGGNSEVIVLAKETSGVRGVLNSLLGGIAVVGLLAAGVAVLLVRFAMNRGLKPLRKLGRQTDAIDAESLHVRFDAGDAPAELKPVYRRLNDLIQRLETSFNRERRFSSDLAHEMRTPVAELKMLNEVALKWPDQGGEKAHAETLEIANQVEAMVETLLTLARLESGEMPLKIEQVEVVGLLKRAWKSQAKKAAEREISVEFEWASERIEVESDPRILRHIMGNLFSNAVEYAPEGGVVSVLGSAGGIEVSISAPALTEEDVAQMFERYWRAEASRSDSKHCGLGLSLARSCAEALGLSLTAGLQQGVVTFVLKNSEA